MTCRPHISNSVEYRLSSDTGDVFEFDSEHLSLRDNTRSSQESLSNGISREGSFSSVNLANQNSSSGEPAEATANDSQSLTNTELVNGFRSRQSSADLNGLNPRASATIYESADSDSYDEIYEGLFIGVLFFVQTVNSDGKSLAVRRSVNHCRVLF